MVFQPTWELEEQAKYLAGLRREEEKEIRERFKEKAARLRQQLMYGQAWGGVQPKPRYRPAFYEMWGALPGSRPYLDYFESLFPSLVQQFQAQLPTYKGFLTARGAAREAEEIGETWADWLRGERKEIRERWWSLRPEQRGERPWAFQPRIQTVEF